MADGSSKWKRLWRGINTVYRIQLTVEISDSETSKDAVHSTYAMPETFVLNFFILKRG